MSAGRSRGQPWADSLQPRLHVNVDGKHDGAAPVVAHDHVVGSALLGGWLREVNAIYPTPTWGWMRSAAVNETSARPAAQSTLQWTF